MCSRWVGENNDIVCSNLPPFHQMPNQRGSIIASYERAGIARASVSLSARHTLAYYQKERTLFSPPESPKTLVFAGIRIFPKFYRGHPERVCIQLVNIVESFIFLGHHSSEPKVRCKLELGKTCFSQHNSISKLSAPR